MLGRPRWAGWGCSDKPPPPGFRAAEGLSQALPDLCLPSAAHSPGQESGLFVASWAELCKEISHRYPGICRAGSWNICACAQSLWGLQAWLLFAPLCTGCASGVQLGSWSCTLDAERSLGPAELLSSRCTDSNLVSCASLLFVGGECSLFFPPINL